MDYRTLGKTGLEVSAVSFGTSPLGDMFGTADESTAEGGFTMHWMRASTSSTPLLTTAAASPSGDSVRR